jgi:Flp pilus assembly protein TadB
MFQGPFWLFFFLSVGTASLFGFLAVASWSESRRRERESYYKNDMLKKIAESQSSAAVATIEYLRDEQKAAALRNAQKKREEYSLFGLITAAIGIGLMVFLRAIVHDEPVYLVGMMPLLIGLALLAHAYLFTGKSIAS